jgi:hypothetical protein
VTEPPRIDDDFLDGCDLDFTIDPTLDADAPYVVLFAGVDLTDRAAVEARARAWRALFGEGHHPARGQYGGDEDDTDRDPPWAIGRPRIDPRDFDRIEE